MGEEKKDSGFSFENTPGKIGGDSQEEFNFSDIPVLGQSEKDKKGGFSFEQKKSDQQPIPYDALKEQPPPGAAGQPEGSAGGSKWDKIAIKKKFSFKFNFSPKMMMIAGAVVLVVVGGVVFLTMKSKSGASGGSTAQGGAKPGKKDPKAEEEARRIAELEKRLADAATMLKDGKFKEALKAYQLLQTESWKDKELALVFGESECYDGLKQDDDAIKGYMKCIDGGWKENSTPYSKAAKILFKKEKGAEALKYLEKGRELFPTESPLGIQLAQAYYNMGQIDKAAAEFKKIEKSTLPLDMLKFYCSILMKKQEKDQAREMYIYGSKKFRDIDCFMSAAELSEKTQDKIDIMNQALANVEESKKSSAIMFLSELLMQTGKKDEAGKQLDKINIGSLKQEKVVDFLKMLVASGNFTKFKTEYKKAIELFPKDQAMHQAVYDSLVENGQDKLAFEIYSDWWSSKGDSCAGFLYAKSLGAMPDEVIEIYNKLIKKNPDFFEALYELGYFYMLKRDWAKSEKAYADCVRLKPKDRNLNQLLAIAKIRNGKGEEAISEYDKFLTGLGLSEEDKAMDLVNLASMLTSSAPMEKYLNVLKNSSKYANEYKVQFLKYKLIHGKASESDFSGEYPKGARIYHEYYLLSKGKTNDVLLMTVPPDEFPDFWKIFIMWRSDMSGWQDLMDALIAKNKGRNDATYGIIAALWNGKLSADDAKKYVEKIHPDNETLFYFMLAERYRKDKVPIKAKVSYQRAISDKMNPISAIAERYSRQPIAEASNPK